MEPGETRVVTVERVATRSAWTAGFTMATLALVAAAATRLLNADAWGVTLCPFKSVTGLACFTCGTTRALGALARLDLPGAFAQQPLVTLGALTAIAWGVLDLALRPSGRRIAVNAPRTALHWTALGAALVANWIYLLSAGI